MSEPGDEPHGPDGQPGAPGGPARTLALVDEVRAGDGVEGVLRANPSTRLDTWLRLPADGEVEIGTRHQLVAGERGILVGAGAGAGADGPGLVPPAGTGLASKVGPASWEVTGTGATDATVAGTPYVEFRSRPTQGQDALVLIPTSAFEAEQVPVVLVTHGASASADMINTPVPANWSTLREPMLDAGWVVCCSNAHGQAWGSDASQADVVAMRARVQAILGAGPTFVVASSMGGLPSLLLVARGQVPGLVGWAGIAPVCSLADMYDGGRGTYAESIAAAYGISPDGSDYEERTEGHDPLLRPATDFAGVPFRFYASPGDTIVGKAANSDAFAAHVAGEVPDATVVPVTGPHLSPAHYLPGDLIPFIAGCLALDRGGAGRGSVRA